MDEPHSLAAARYIALNPVVAGLVSRAEDRLMVDGELELAAPGLMAAAIFVFLECSTSSPGPIPSGA